MKFHIETKRLILQDILPSDLDAFFEMDSHPKVHTYLGNNPITEKAQIINAIENIRQQYVDYGIGRWAVIEKESGQFIGWSGLKYITQYKNNHIQFHDVGYRLHPTYWGKGYATESAKAAIQFGFENLQLSTIYGTANIHNKASIHALEKCGLSFVETFIHPQFNFPCVWMQLSSKDWNIQAK